MSYNLEASVRDPERLRALAETELLDSAPELAFDRLTRLASKILRVPTAVVSLVDDHRQFFKSAVGLGEPWATLRETPLSHSFCQHAVASREPLVVFDAREHPVLRTNGAVADLGVIAYAGVPLITSDEQSLGALCVIEPTPRRWTDEELEILRELAESVVTEIDLRRLARESRERAREAEEATARATAAEVRYRELIDGLDAVVWEADFATTKLTYVSPQCETLMGRSPASWMAAPNFAAEYVHPDDVPVVTRCYRQVWKGRETEVEFRAAKLGGGEVCVRGRMRPVRDATGAVRGARGVLVDVTGRKTIEVELTRQTNALAILRAASDAANAAVSGLDGLQRFVDAFCAYTGWPVGHAYVKRGEALLPGEVWNASLPERFAPFRDLTMRTILESGVGLPGRVLASGESASVADLRLEPQLPRAGVAADLGLRTALVFPVRVGAEVVAVLEFFTDAEVPVDDRTRRVMTDVGTQLGRAIERERHAAAVASLSVTDELTGLHNRRGFMVLAAQALSLATRQRKSAQLCFIDMDGLKRINDEIGHEAGDRALVELAGVLKKTFRQSDVVARLGGDEFVIFAPEASEHTKPSIRARLDAQIAAHNDGPGREFVLSASVGLTTYDPAAPETLEALLSRADALMYEQKRARKAAR